MNFSYVIPGKLAGSARPGAWGDVRSDLTGLSRAGIGALVSLTEQPLERKAVRDSGLRYLHLPVPDFRAPGQAQIAEFVAFADACIGDGMAVAVHCAAGMGRTGTMLSCYLVSTGLEPDAAIAAVRRIRPGSVETPAQEQCVREYSETRRGSAGK